MPLSLPSILTTAATGAGAAYAASWLHELAHAAATIALGGQVSDIRLWPAMSVGVVGLSGRRLAVARHAPFLLGMLVVPLLAAVTPPLWVWAGWAVLSFSGGDGEVSPAFFAARVPYSDYDS